MDENYIIFHEKVMEYIDLEYKDSYDNYQCAGLPHNVETFGMVNYQDLQNEIEEKMKQCFVNFHTIPYTSGSVIDLIAENMGRPCNFEYDLGE